jgi:hypothetical protein
MQILNIYTYFVKIQVFILATLIAFTLATSYDKYDHGIGYEVIYTDDFDNHYPPISSTSRQMNGLGYTIPTVRNVRRKMYATMSYPR